MSRPHNTTIGSVWTPTIDGVQQTDLQHSFCDQSEQAQQCSCAVREKIALKQFTNYCTNSLLEIALNSTCHWFATGLQQLEGTYASQILNQVSSKTSSTKVLIIQCVGMCLLYRFFAGLQINRSEIRLYLQLKMQAPHTQASLFVVPATLENLNSKCQEAWYIYHICTH